MAINPSDIQSSASFDAANSAIPNISSTTPQNSWWDMTKNALRLGYSKENPTILGMTPDVFSTLAGGLASALAPPQFGPTGQYIGPSAAGQVGAFMQQRAQSNMLMQMLKEAIGKKEQNTDINQMYLTPKLNVEPFGSISEILRKGDN